MRIRTLAAFSLTLALVLPVYAEMFGEMDGVYLYRESMFDHTGHDYGFQYSTQNNNDFAVCLSIWVDDGYNYQSGLVGSQPPMIVYPGETVDLGWVVQWDTEEDANWSVDAEWNTDCY